MNAQTDFAASTELHAASRPGNIALGTEALAAFARRAAGLRSALEALAEASDKGGAKATQKLIDRLDAFEPAITVIGQVKAGKTALINAMAGWPDLLPSDVNPWTSVVTSLHLTPGRERRSTGARFEFLTEAEWDSLTAKGGRMGELAGRAGAESELAKLSAQVEMIREKSRKRLGRKFELLMGQAHDYGYFDANLLERYICLGDDFDIETDGATTETQGRFADITRSAELSLNSQTLPFRMCLRDTPGVNDTFMMREQITIRAIRDSRICVVVLSAGQALTTVDMGLIRLISNLKSREVIFYVNRIDELSDPARQVPEIEQSIRATLKKHHGPHEAAIVFGSAHWANRALSDSIEEMSDGSVETLLGWGRARLTARDDNDSPRDMVWELSGVPDLLRALSERVVQTAGEPMLARTAASAIKVATGQQAAHGVRVQGGAVAGDLAPEDIRGAFASLRSNRLQALALDLDDQIRAFQDRADRSHETFLGRATHSLIEHLQLWGDGVVWEYDPSGLRMLLRSAYALLGTRTQSVAQQHYELAVQDIAALLHRGFGTAVEGMEIGVPPVPETPAPVGLGQMIALDVNDGWWVAWWRRKRGYDSFARKFGALIGAETQDYMRQIKFDQPLEIKLAMAARLEAEFEEYGHVLEDLLAAPSGAASDTARKAGGMGRKALDQVLVRLRGFTDETGSDSRRAT